MFLFIGQQRNVFSSIEEGGDRRDIELLRVAHTTMGLRTAAAGHIGGGALRRRKCDDGGP